MNDTMASDDLQVGTLLPFSRKIARRILSVVRRVNCKPAYVGGCRAFFSVRDWLAAGRVPDFMPDKCTALIVQHDGGDLAPFFNSAYGHAGFDKMAKQLSTLGVFAEAITSCITAVQVDEMTTGVMNDAIVYADWQSDVCLLVLAELVYPRDHFGALIPANRLDEKLRHGQQALQKVASQTTYRCLHVRKKV